MRAPHHLPYLPLKSPLALIRGIVRAADLVQEIYLRELKAYKPVPEKASDAEGQVKKWSPPAPPKAPDSIGATLADELKAYEAAEVEVEGQASTTDGASAKDDDWFEEDLAFPPEEDAHH